LGKRKIPAIEYNAAHESHGDKNVRWVENVSRGLRRVGFADEIASAEGCSRMIDHKGWFTDDAYQGDVYRGVVYQLPSRGEPLYVYGYDDPNNEGSALLCFETETKKLEAARRADSFAEVRAEEQREYQNAWRAGRRVEEIADEIAKYRKDALAIGAEMRAAKQTVRVAPTICATLRAKIYGLYNEIREARKERDDLVECFGERPGFVE
jgi:hypothetical protein